MSYAGPILQVRHVTKEFFSKGGVVTAVRDASFDVEEGQIVCLVGTSGCGKSTLLSMVVGLEEPTRGEILLDGKPIAGPGPDRGMVFQRDCLFPWLTVRGNVRFGLKLSAYADTPGGIELGLDRAEALIDKVGLGRFKDAYPKQLSGGMRQRAAIARALVTRPRMLLMDEPFGALDAQTREEMQAMLLDLCREQKTTVLFVTHDVEEAVFLADRVIVMKAHPGEIVADLPIDLPQPRHTDIKLDDAFNRQRRDILALLHQKNPRNPRNPAPPEEAALAT